MNSAVNRLRDALGDKASNSRFIETLARRGYRFVAPVERISLNGNSPASAPGLPLSEEAAVTPANPVAPAESKPGLLDRILATPDDLPKSPHLVVQTLFILLQLMYLAFYIAALANLEEISQLLSSLSFAKHALNVTMFTATLLIPVRTFLICAVLFHAPGLREKFRKIWWFLLPFDLLWSLSPFLLLHHINYGLALACMTFLVYSPFAQRSLVLMGAGTAISKIESPLVESQRTTPTKTRL